jgi:hypothetical protein
MNAHYLKPSMKQLKSTACALSAILAMLVGSLRAQQVPIPHT